MQHIILACSFLHQMQMTVGERIGIHYDTGHSLALTVSLSQVGTIIGKTVRGILHKYQIIAHTGDLIKSLHIGGRSYLSVHKEMVIAALFLHLGQMCHDARHQALMPMLLSDGQTAQCIAETTAGSDQIAFIIKNTTGIIEIFIPLNTLLLQKHIHPEIQTVIPFGDLLQFTYHNAHLFPFYQRLLYSNIYRSTYLKHCIHYTTFCR